VSFGETVEKAYWWTEILDAYCKILMLSKDLGRVTYLSKNETQELLALKQQWGFKDPRLDKNMENCDICANDVFRTSWGNTGVSRSAFDPPPAMNTAPSSSQNIDYEAVVKAVTEQVCKELGLSA
jgi:L-fuculose-phosphate aldolase